MPVPEPFLGLCDELFRTEALQILGTTDYDPHVVTEVCSRIARREGWSARREADLVRYVEWYQGEVYGR